MKKKTFFPKSTLLSVRSLILCILITGGGCFTYLKSNPSDTSTNSEMNGKVEITLSYERQEGRGSNQYAVWIEDDQGKLVKTLFVTKFTAQKGWQKRPACTPLWVEKADADNLSQEELDSVTGATPPTGIQNYIWDGTDKNGNKVKPGIYTFVVQASLINDNLALFKGEINTAGTGVVVTTTPVYNTDNDSHRSMIGDVSARFVP